MLELHKVYKTYPNHFQAILQGIDLNLTPGEFCILLGCNGSGKSSLMKAIAGEISIDSGQILKKSNVAMVTQDINKGTIPEMTLLENIVLSELSNQSPSFKFYNNRQKQVVDELSKLKLGIEKYVNSPLGNLSGGQRQIIATFMAIESKAEILLLDEHTSALDPKMQKILMDYTANKIKEKKLTTLMITHKLDDAIKYGDRLIMLHQGKIVFDIDGSKKKNISIEKLLDLFHKYEDSDHIK